MGKPITVLSATPLSSDDPLLQNSITNEKQCLLSRAASSTSLPSTSNTTLSRAASSTSLPSTSNTTLSRAASSTSLPSTSNTTQSSEPCTTSLHTTMHTVIDANADNQSLQLHSASIEVMEAMKNTVIIDRCLKRKFTLRPFALFLLLNKLRTTKPCSEQALLKVLVSPESSVKTLVSLCKSDDNIKVNQFITAVEKEANVEALWDLLKTFINLGDDQLLPGDIVDQLDVKDKGKMSRVVNGLGEGRKFYLKSLCQFINEYIKLVNSPTCTAQAAAVAMSCVICPSARVNSKDRIGSSRGEKIVALLMFLIGNYNILFNKRWSKTTILRAEGLVNEESYFNTFLNTSDVDVFHLPTKFKCHFNFLEPLMIKIGENLPKVYEAMVRDLNVASKNKEVDIQPFLTVPSFLNQKFLKDKSPAILYAMLVAYLQKLPAPLLPLMPAMKINEKFKITAGYYAVPQREMNGLRKLMFMTIMNTLVPPNPGKTNQFITALELVACECLAAPMAKLKRKEMKLNEPGGTGGLLLKAIIDKYAKLFPHNLASEGRMDASKAYKTI